MLDSKRRLAVGLVMCAVCTVLFPLSAFSQALKVQKDGYKKSNRNQIGITSEKMDGAIKSKVVHTSKKTDYTATAEITKLKPDTRYYYEVYVNGDRVDIPYQPTFMRFSNTATTAVCRIQYTGGLQLTPQSTLYGTTTISLSTIIRAAGRILTFLNGNGRYGTYSPRTS